MSRRALTLLLLSVAASAAGAQALQPELRVDAIGPAPLSPQVGVGLNGTAGIYVRWTIAAGWGPRRVDGATRDEWRGDLLARVTLDPFGQQPWALSIGGGLSVRRNAYLAVIADLEGPTTLGWRPALQAGASGGVRLGLVLRRAVSGRR